MIICINFLKWILGGSTLFMGCIGKDEFGIMIKEKMNKIGLQLALEEISKAPTASCAVLLTNNNRTMVAHIGAVSYFSLDYLEKHLANLESIKIFYVTVSEIF
jgi:adenosine kinase